MAFQSCSDSRGGSIAEDNEKHLSHTNVDSSQVEEPLQSTRKAGTLRLPDVKMTLWAWFVLRISWAYKMQGCKAEN